MIYIITSLYVMGDEFDPELAETQLALKFSQKDLKGSRLPWGKARTYGAAVLSSSAHGFKSSITCSFEDFILMASTLLPILKSMNADNISIHQQIFHDGQCNLQYSVNELQLLSSLSLDFTVSCTQDDSFLAEVEKYLLLLESDQSRGAIS